MAGRGINKVILVGNLGADPEVRYTQNGDAIANLRVATSEIWNDKSGQRQERTEWHRVVMFGKLAEITQQYLSKGRQVYIEGSIRTRKWQDKEGRDQYTTEIVASEMQMLGGGRQDEGEPAHHGASRSAPAPRKDQDARSKEGASYDAWGQSSAFPDDDIPF